MCQAETTFDLICQADGRKAGVSAELKGEGLSENTTIEEAHICESFFSRDESVSAVKSETKGTASMTAEARARAAERSAVRLQLESRQAFTRLRRSVSARSILQMMVRFYYYCFILVRLSWQKFFCVGGLDEIFFEVIFLLLIFPVAFAARAGLGFRLSSSLCCRPYARCFNCN